MSVQYERKPEGTYGLPIQNGNLRCLGLQEASSVCEGCGYVVQKEICKPNDASQQWRFDVLPDNVGVQGRFNPLVNSANELCLGIEDGSSDGGARAVYAVCSGREDQLWKFVDQQMLINRNDKVLMVQDALQTNGASLIQMDEHEHPAGNTLSAAFDGSRQCLQSTGGGDGSAVRTVDCSEDDDGYDDTVLWSRYPGGRFQNKASKKCLSATDPRPTVGQCSWAATEEVAAAFDQVTSCPSTVFPECSGTICGTLTSEGECLGMSIPGMSNSELGALCQWTPDDIGGREAVEHDCRADDSRQIWTLEEGEGGESSLKHEGDCLEERCLNFTFGGVYLSPSWTMERQWKRADSSRGGDFKGYKAWEW